MSGRYRHFTEEDYRPRAHKSGTRPRTKNRPAHADAEEGMVVSVDRGRYRVVMSTELADVSAGSLPVVTCVRAKWLRRTPVVPGDRVRVVGDTSGKEGTLARLVDIVERDTVLRRSADDTDATERVIVANADQLVVVTATAEPDPSWGLIDRALTAAFDAGIRPVLAVTKLDLAPVDEVYDRFGSVDVEIVPCGFDPAGVPRVDRLREVLTGHLSVLLGHSGVGKSTLMNALVPQAQRATGAVNDVTGHGRHTSSSAACLPLPTGGWIVDTPGVRSFGLAHVDVENVVAAFADLVPATADCPKGCTHRTDSPGCTLDSWVATGQAGEAGAARLASLRRLLDNLADRDPAA
ncbi:ribosome small subunit-dependent GTPase A [Brevibacterium litoralis]|uniref:ribosome small subunit-dependent GTPase A n=1 Tax=Brevibacterium litoralis TaxID=3138935 RepID=UPI0032F01C7E